MLAQSSYTIKPRTWPIWIFFAMSGVPGLAILITESKKLAGLYVLGVAVVFCLLLYLHTRLLKIYIDEQVLTYHAFGRRKTIAWKDIKKSSVSWSIEGTHSAGPSWIYASFDNTRIEIPLGYYSRSDMRLLAAQTIAKAKQAEIGLKIHQFSEGIFPWYLF